MKFLGVLSKEGRHNTHVLSFPPPFAQLTFGAAYNHERLMANERFIEGL